MTIALDQKQGLIAGDGLLPVKMAQHAKENGFDVVAISLSLMLSTSINNLLAYFTYEHARINEFTIDAEYIVEFDANTGTGTMSPQTISYNVPTNLTTNAYTKSGYASPNCATAIGSYTSG